MDTHGQRDETETQADAAAAPDTWLSAIRGLRDNPLAQAHKLRQRRTSKRALVYWWSAALLAGVGDATYGFFAATPFVASGQLWSGSLWIAIFRNSTMIMLAVWVFRALFNAFSSWLSLLNRNAAGVPGRLDETLACSQISDCEIITGFASGSIKPLIAPVAVWIVMLLAALWSWAYDQSGMFTLHTPAAFGNTAQYQQFVAGASWTWQIILHSLPAFTFLSAIMLLACAALAIVNLYLLLLGLGCRSAAPVQTCIEAGLLAALQVAWVLICGKLPRPLFASLAATRTASFQLEDCLIAAAFALLLAVSLYAGVMLLPGLWRAFSATLWVAAALIHNILAVFIRFTGWNYGGWQYMALSPWKTFAFTTVYLFSMLNIVNPLGIPANLYFNSISQGASAALQPNVFGEPLIIILVQLILLPILARFALGAVRRYRQAAE